MNLAKNELTGDVFVIISNQGKKFNNSGGKIRSLSINSKKVFNLVCDLLLIKKFNNEKRILQISQNLSKDEKQLVFKIKN